MNKILLSSVVYSATLLMNILLPKSKLFYVISFLFVINGAIIAQCTITGTVNANTLTCGTSPLSACNGVLYIGDGTTSTSLYMNASLNLTCLGPIQLIVRNGGGLDFSAGNDYLILAEGSSVFFETGSSLIGGSCNASERLYIGTNLLASCNGSAGADLSFEDLLSFGGTGSAASNSPVCLGNNIILSATPPPNGAFTYKWVGPNSFTSTLQNPAPFVATAAAAGIYTVTMKRTSDGKSIDAYVSVVVNSGTFPSEPTLSLVQPTCTVATGSITITSPVPDGVLKYSINGLNYTNISGIFNPVSSGTYNVTVKNSSGCISPAASAEINSQPITPSITAMTNSACSGVSFTSTPVNSTNGVVPSGTTYSWSAPTVTGGLTGGVSGSGSSITGVLINPTNTAQTATYTVTPTSGSCTGATFTVTVTVNPAPPTPILYEIIQPNCITPTGSVELRGLIVGGTVNETNGPGVTSYAVNGTSMTFTGLTAGTYNFSESVGACTSPATENVEIKPTITNTWNGTTLGWSAGHTPTSDEAVFFAAPYTVTSLLNACSCTINSGVNVVVGDAIDGIASGNAILKIVNGLTVNGALTFENNASLVQVNNAAVNSGNIIYKRNTPALKTYDYVYWGSPVASQSLTTLASNTDLYYSWTGSAWYAESSTMTPGKGYIIRVNANLTSQTGTFTGIPNNGNVVYTAPAGAYSLVSNPYPSAISADEFIKANFTVTATTGGATLYFWTHNTARALNTAGNQLVYSSNDYASYNLTGGTVTAKKAVSDLNTPGKVPTGQIAAGQAFFVARNTTGDFNFNNQMRISSQGNNSQFFRQASTKKSAIVEKSRIWLDLSNEGGAFKQLLVGYIDGATNDYDNFYDGVSYNGNSFVDFYSLNNAKSLTIQGRGLPFDPTDQVPLGYKTTIAGKFTIGIDAVDGVLKDQPIYLEDKLTGKTQDLKSGDYSFTTAIGTFKDRFVLRYTYTAKLDTKDIEANDTGVIVSVKNSQIKVNSFDENIVAVKVYDLKGSLVYEKDKVDKNEFIIDHLTSSDQFLIVMIQLENGKWVTEEIIFHD